MSSIILNPFQLLELNIISAQDLAKVTRSMRVYAVAWIHPDRKLTTRVDTQGGNNPKWNDKFVFRVDDDFLSSDMSAVNIDIYAVHWFKDALVGRVRVLMSTLMSPSSRPARHQQSRGLRFAALHVRRPSGRPHGILNIGVAVLDSSMRSMPLHQELNLPPAQEYHDLITQQKPNSCNPNDCPQQQEENQQTSGVKPVLRRSKSDMSSMHGARILKRTVSFSEKPNSVINASDVTSSAHGKSLKGSSSAPSSMLNASILTSSLAVGKGKVLDYPANLESASSPEVAAHKPISPVTTRENKVANAALSPLNPSVNKLKQGPTNNIVNKSTAKNLAITSGPVAPTKFRNLYVAESEPGPMPTEVLAAKYQTHMNDGESTIADGEWSLVESEEGLQSKLARWQMEIPAIYSRGQTMTTILTSTEDGNTIVKPGTSSSSRGQSRSRRSRRHTDRAASITPGLFACVSNIWGCKCSIVCGNGPPVLE